MRRFGPAQLLALLVVLLAVPADGGEPGEVRQLIEQLGSPEFGEREAASMKLAALGGQALDALLDAAADNADPEIRRRALELLGPLERLEPAKLVGAWELVSCAQGGKSIRPGTLSFPTDAQVTERNANLVLLFCGKRWTCDVGLRGKPKEITLWRCLTVTRTGQPTHGEAQLGIYETSPDRLRICFAAAGDKRPTAFATQAGSDTLLLVLKRKARD